MLALSDGMGSGEAACRDSEAVVDMAESMLEAGIDAQMAVRLMNSAMAGEGSAECLPTLDLCTLDLHEGECTFLKAGAAASFVKHGSVVERISGASLPLGALGEAQPQPVKRGVSDGDYIILMTDGMTESWPDGEGGEEAGDDPFRHERHFPLRNGGPSAAGRHRTARRKDPRRYDGALRRDLGKKRWRRGRLGRRNAFLTCRSASDRHLPDQ